MQYIIHTHICRYKDTYTHTHTHRYDQMLHYETHMVYKIFTEELKMMSNCILPACEKGNGQRKKKGAYMAPYINICNPIRPKGNILNAEIRIFLKIHSFTRQKPVTEI